VERLGGERWLAVHGSQSARQEYAQFDTRRRQFRALSLATRTRLLDIYQKNESSTVDRQTLIEMKNTVMQDFRDDYARLKAEWGGYKTYDAWVASANNAAFGAQAAYDELVPGFEALFDRQGKDWQRFYDAVKQLATRPAIERTRYLKQITKEHPGD
jgi:predicted aminopeptidase